MGVDELLAAIDALPERDLLRLHREVCRRAAGVYGRLYGAVQRAHYMTAMAARDTRFRKGLTPMENVERNMRLAERV